MILDKIREIISEHTGIEIGEIEMDTDLTDDLQLDSIDAFEILSQVEDEFDIQVDEEMLGKVKSIGDIVRYLEDKTEQE